MESFESHSLGIYAVDIVNKQLLQHCAPVPIGVNHPWGIALYVFNYTVWFYSRVVMDS